MIVVGTIVHYDSLLAGFTNTGKAGSKKAGPSAQELTRLVRYVVSDGYHRYDEMFVWADDLIHKVPDIVNAIRGRFPILFIDEAQV